MKKRCLATLLALAMCLTLLPAVALAADDDFVIENGVLTRYNGPGGDIVIPEGVVNIGWAAFEGSAAVTHITLPNSVVSINYGVFDDCTELTGFSVSSNNRSFSVEDGVLFNKDKTTLVRYPLAKAGTEYIIPASVTAIGLCALRNSSGLTKVVIPEGVKTIQAWAFSGCTNLTDANEPASVTWIDGRNFEDTPWLKSQGAFGMFGNVLLKYQGQGGEVTIPDGVTEIGTSAFYGQTAVTKVTLPEGVTNIGMSAFQNCTSLEEVRIPQSVTEVGMAAFDGTPWQTAQGDFLIINGILLSYQGQRGEVDIPNGVTEIAPEAFQNCTTLTGVTIPDGVTEIGWLAFNGCTALSRVEIPDSVTSFGDRVFEGTPWLEAQGEFPVVNGTLLKYQGQGGDVIIPDGVSVIGSYAFWNCHSLTSITIPKSVTAVMLNAFLDCYNLTDVYYGGGIEDWKVDFHAAVDDRLLAADIHYQYGAPGTAQEGEMKSADGANISWEMSATGAFSVDPTNLASEEAVLVACYDNDGRFTGVKPLDTGRPEAQIDPATPNVRLFWLNGAQAPQSRSVTVWGK